MTARNTWKSFERRVAKAVGGRRIPVTGIDRNGCDVDAGPFVYQVKLRQGQPGYLRDWLSGICGQTSDGTGVVIWKEPGGRDDEAIVVLRFKDWIAHHGK
jgi:hypothetical protein